MNAEQERFQSALAALRQTFGQGLEQALPGVLAKLDESLFDLGEASTDSELQTLYHKLRTTVQDERSNILASFRQTLQSCMEKRSGSKNPAANDTPFNLQTLSLVEFDEMEESLGINGLTQRLTETCAEELGALTSRLKRILGKASLSDSDNPFGPEMIAKAMGQSFAMIEGVRPKLLLFKTLAEPLRDPLRALYRQLNETMAAQGFDLSAATIVKAANRPAQAAGVPAAPAAAAQTAAPAAVEQAAAADDLFAVLQQLVRPGGTTQPGGAPAPAEGTSAAALPTLGFPPVTGAAAVPLATPELLSTLSQIQHAIPRGELPAAGLPQDQTAAPVSLNAAELTAGLTNVLHHIRQTPTYSSASQVDAITIDVVAMMFDFIFDDDDIPASVKGLIGRLQIPVLKAAMLDKKFFSKKDNPARKLLDRIAHAAIGWHSEIDTNDPLYRKLDELIRHIVDNFEDNSEIFSQATAQLDEFLQQEEMRAEARSRAVKEEIRKRELKESAPEMARQQVDKWCQDSRCTAMLQDFLRQYWVTPLADAYAVNGQDSPEWTRACRTIDDLLWSVERKTTAAERARLLKELPPLLQTLSEAMEQQHAAEEFSSALFAHLVEIHTAALKGQAATAATEDQPETSADQTAPIAAAQPGTAPSADRPLPSGGEIDTAEMYSGDVQVVAPDVPEGDEFDRIAHSIAKGTWVEFKLDKGDSIRCRLLWTSPLRGSHLFSSRDGGNAIKISPSGLASRLRKGKAIILQDQPLVDRVVDNVLSRLKRGQAPTA